jgi:uncharacterized OB-fold protein
VSYFDASRQEMADAYVTGLSRDGLSVQRCVVCGAFRFPPLIRCERCGSRESQWTPVHRGVIAALSDKPDRPGPEGRTIIVAISESCRVPAVGGAGAADLQIGDTVSFVRQTSVDQPPKVAVVVRAER